MFIDTDSIKLGYYTYRSGFRFFDNRLADLKGKKIESATLFLTSDLNTSSPISLKIYGEKSNNCTTFINVQNNLGNRIITNSYTSWDLSKESWSINSRYSSPNIKNVIQEIVDFPDFSGSSLCIIIQDNNSRVYSERLVSAKENTVRSGATLKIVYY